MDNRPPEVHCPFGCTLPDCDERGYCHHLLGFQVSETTYEAVERDVVRGHLVVSSKNRKKIGPKDKLVNPEDQQFDQGVYHTRKRWINARVYNRDVPAPQKATA